MIRRLGLHLRVLNTTEMAALARFQAEAKDRVRQQRTALSHTIMLLVSEGFNGP